MDTIHALFKHCIVKCKLLDSLTLTFPLSNTRVGDGLTESDLEDSSDEEEARN